MLTKDIPIRQRIGSRLAEIRKANNLTQTEVAERAGIRQQHVARLESGKYNATIDLLDRVARALHCDIDVKEL